MDDDLRVRRDGEPHCGELWSILGQLALVAAYLSFLLFVPVLLALPLAWFVKNRTERDLAEIEQGRMDWRGMLETERAQGTALDALACSATALLGWGLIILVVVTCHRPG